MKIELVVGNEKKKMLEKKYSIYDINSTFSYASAFYNCVNDLTIVNLRSFKVMNTDDDIDKFIYNFTNTIGHETVHKCIADERNNSKRFKSWYDKAFIISQVKEEGVVYSMITENSRDGVNYVMLRTLMNKVHHIIRNMEYQKTLLSWYRIMFIIFYLFSAGLFIYYKLRYG